jgi:hypothetical protein
MPPYYCFTVAQGVLEELNRRLPHGMGVVTGRPRKDCNTFIKVCMLHLTDLKKSVPIAVVMQLSCLKISQQ